MLKSTFLLGLLAYSPPINASPARTLAPRQTGWPWGSGGFPWGSSGSGGSTCQWTGHCLGDPCETENDCDGNMWCQAGRCANPTGGGAQPNFPIPTGLPAQPGSGFPSGFPTGFPSFPTGWPWGPGGNTGGSTPCVWEGHCLGDPCETENDCDGDMFCQNSRCTNPTPTSLPNFPTALPSFPVFTPGFPGGGLTTIIRTTTVYVTATPSSTPTPTSWTCVWEGHCLGDPCETEIDCDGHLACSAGKCAEPTTEPAPTSAWTCVWEGHCHGDPCETEIDCDGHLACISGACAEPTL